jgi:hypothetical protein
MKKSAICAIVIMLLGCSKRPDHPSDVGAYIACKDFVSHNLAAPRTASFDSMSNTPVKELRKVHKANDRLTGYYLVAGYVQAQNAFGAMVQTAYTCQVSKTTGEPWKLNHLKID